MSGHSKWATIKRKKAATDAKRGKIFTKMIKEITVAARMGGGDPEGNARLRMAIMNAKSVNMPWENIERAIKRGTGELEGVRYEEITYEGYGPCGTAMLINVLTDNRNRTTAEIRHILAKYNASLGETGSVSWMFKRKGVFTFSKGELTEEGAYNLATEVGAEDINELADEFEMITSPEDFENIKKEIDRRNIKYIEASISMIPNSYVTLKGKDAELMMKLMDTLEDSDDVQNIYTNSDIIEEG